MDIMKAPTHISRAVAAHKEQGRQLFSKGDVTGVLGAYDADWQPCFRLRKAFGQEWK